jgi:NNP family nitrate/nitrite transporter-like MFS transporter
MVTLLTAPAVFTVALVTNGMGFLLCRLFIGFSLCTFVGCQFWCSSMFSTKIVGTGEAPACSGNLACSL